MKISEMEEDKDYSVDFLLEEWGQVKLYHHINRGDIFQVNKGYYRRTQ